MNLFGWRFYVNKRVRGNRTNVTKAFRGSAGMWNVDSLLFCSIFPVLKTNLERDPAERWRKPYLHCIHQLCFGPWHPVVLQHMGQRWNGLWRTHVSSLCFTAEVISQKFVGSRCKCHLLHPQLHRYATTPSANQAGCISEDVRWLLAFCIYGKPPSIYALLAISNICIISQEIQLGQKVNLIKSGA